MLELNKSITCVWQRVCPGLYQLGDITVERIWHDEGVCAGNYMWHVFINDRTFVKWAYLRDAKASAHTIDREANKPLNSEREGRAEPV